MQDVGDAGCLVDRFNRKIDYLRLSINRECSFSCIYCDKEGYPEGQPGTRLSPQDVKAIVGFFHETFGIRKVKITGGEPLEHPRILQVVNEISRLPNITDLSMTTNGFQLSTMAWELKVAGLDRVNVSLCSLDRATYKQITGIDGMKRVIEGIQAARDAGLTPLKINVVLLKGINDHEIDDMLVFCGKLDARLQLIELHEIDAVHGNQHGFFNRHHIDVSKVLDRITIPVKSIEYRDMQHRKIIHFKNGASMEIVEITPSFCAACTKIRVTASGILKPCLMQEGEPVDILTPLKHGSHEQAMKVLSDAIKTRKPFMVEDGKEKIVQVMITFHAEARDAAGLSSIILSVIPHNNQASIDDVLIALEERFGEKLMPAVLQRDEIHGLQLQKGYKIMVEDQLLDPRNDKNHEVEPGSTIRILPPFSGG